MKMVMQPWIKKPQHLDSLSIAQAAKNSGGNCIITGRKSC